jgi:D-glycero-alpha-D-manno-heptose-7-phosphate kinase
MSAFEATAPTRIDLAGGTLDLWPLYLLHPGSVTINVAVDRRAWCRVSTDVNGVKLESKDTQVTAEGRDLSELIAKGSLPFLANILRALGIETGIHVVTQSRVPAGSGLGVSSALAVAVAAAAARAVGKSLTPDELWPIVRDAEATSAGVPTGIQDYQAALLGGVLDIRLDPGRVSVQRLTDDVSRVEAHLCLVDAGVTRFSGINNWDVFKRRIDGETSVREALSAIASVSQRLRGALVDQRYGDVPALLREEWEARKRMAPAVTTPEIDRIAEIAAAAGGAARACGAGGGGMVAVWIDPAGRASVTNLLKDAGFEAVPIRIDMQGLVVEEVR